MSRELYLCVHAAEYPAQALLRLRTDLQPEPVAVLDGRSPLETICALNRNARLRGAVPGMTRLEAEGIASLHLFPRSTEGEAAARAVFLECVANFSPRIEEASRDTACIFVLDIAGTEMLFGPPQQLAERLRTALTEAGFRVSIAVSANFHTAKLKAAASRGITVVPEGEESRALAKLPIAALSLAPEHEETFAIWGIRTLNELAALPEAELISRLGTEARRWRELAHGAASHTFQPIEPEFSLKEVCEFETPVEQMDSLLFVGARMIDCLTARAATKAMSLASFTVEMKMEGGPIHRLSIRPALPSVDRKFLLKLLQLEIAAHPPRAAVQSLTMTAEAGQSSKVQLGLFAQQTPEPSRLDVTIARLKALAGEDRVGSPRLEDTHRAGSFRMENFVAENHSVATKVQRPHMALRRMRPPLAVRMVMRADRPAIFHDGQRSYRVEAAFGPWRSQGSWWAADSWDTDEWDVLAQAQDSSPVACLLVLDHTQDRWRLEAFYD